MKIERIEELMMAEVLTTSEKSEILAAAKELGVTVNVRIDCRRCYEEALDEIYKIMNTVEAVSIDGYKFKKRGKSFRNGCRLFSQSTLARMEVGSLHPSIIEKYFVKVEQKENENGYDSDIRSETEGQME